METAPPVTSSDLSHLEQHGWLKVPGLIPLGPARDAREFIYQRLDEAGLWVDGKWHEPTTDATQSPVREFTRSISKSRWFKPLFDSNVLSVASMLCAGQQVVPTKPFCQFLFTAPYTSAGNPNPVSRWTVPSTIWHTDYPRDGATKSYGVQVFTFIDQVVPEGGGTLIVSGSHRIRPGRVLGSKELKQSLRGEAFWRDLTNKRLENRSRLEDFTGEIDGVSLRLVELSGEPGDVYFTDLRLLHSLTPNTSPRPRLMLTQRLPTESGLTRIDNHLSELRSQRNSDERLRM